MEISETPGLLFPMVPRLHQSNGYIKRKLCVWRAQKCNALVGAETVLTSVGTRTTPFPDGQYREGPEWKYAKFRAYKSPWYRICTKAMVLSNGSYVYGELKNVMLLLVQNPYLPVRGRKLPCFFGAVQGQEWKYAKLRAYQSPWYRIFSKAMVILKGSYI